MRIITRTCIWATTLGLSLLIVACGPTNTDDAAEAVAATLIALEVEAALAPTQEPLPEEPPTMEPEPLPTSTLTPSPTIVHIAIPDSPAGLNGFITDPSTELLAAERRSLSDNFEINLLERPYTSEAMDYRPELDIIRAEISKNGAFLYVTIFLESAPPADSQAHYGVEVDSDRDGRGDWLILVASPLSSTWTTDGVRACRDSDEDVGGATPMRADTPGGNLNGYDDCVFENGIGISPDEAWVRQDPSDSARVQIAFLHSLIDSQTQFLWGVWADAGEYSAERFDYHDRFTSIEAGSANVTNSNYPIKALALVDNTCRWAYGFTPNASDPGICLLPPTPKPEAAVCEKPPHPDPQNNCWVWNGSACQWICIN